MIRAQRNHYLVQVKDNCAGLMARARQIMQTSPPRDAFVTCDRQKGRLEIRQVRLYDWSGSRSGWQAADIATLIVVNRWTHRQQTVSHTQHFYLSDLKQLSAAAFARLVRGHWSIENKLHWVKDVILSEDRATLSGANAAENLSTFKDFAINVFRKHGHTSIKYALVSFANKVSKLWHLILSF